MPSPFPGMDPYLEGYLWPDVHNALAAKLRQLLTPLLRPRYTARLAIYMVEDIAPESEIGIMYPDVEVLLSEPSRQEHTSDEALSRDVSIPAPLTLPALQPIDMRIVNVEIRDTAHNRLVTCIAILSPVNKREPGLTVYRHKRHRLYQAGVHLVEVDFIRRAHRVVSVTLHNHLHVVLRAVGRVTLHNDAHSPRLRDKVLHHFAKQCLFGPVR